MTDAPDPRLVVRDAIADRMADWLSEAGIGEPFQERDLADAVMELFEVGEETWLIATVPGVDGPVDLRTQIHMPDRQPVTHTRLVLRSEPVPVEPGWRTDGAAA